MHETLARHFGVSRGPTRIQVTQHNHFKLSPDPRNRFPDSGNQLDILSAVRAVGSLPLEVHPDKLQDTRASLPLCRHDSKRERCKLFLNWQLVGERLRHTPTPSPEPRRDRPWDKAPSHEYQNPQRPSVKLSVRRSGLPAWGQGDRSVSLSQQWISF